MTDEQLRIRVAELAGWTDIRTLTHDDLYSDENLYGWVGSPGGVPPWYTGTNPRDNMEALPCYESDLNAMRSLVHALRSLPGPQWHDFHTRLIDVCGSVGNAINADARTRSETFVKVIEATT